MEPHLFQIAPGVDSDGSNSPEGGKLEVWVDEIEHYMLEIRSSLHFEHTAHRWQSLRESETLL